ncbi:MAG: 50S ribosomal protein L11 methyltransferase [Dehalococcoidia bacterium]|nr:50S ribosomal protein L11 methyltransferase [Dehalococcoidia bacterium]
MSAASEAAPDWWQIAILAPATQAEQIAEALTPLVYGGVASHPAVAPIEGTEEYLLPAGSPTQVIGYLPVDEALDARRAEIRALLRDHWPNAPFAEGDLQDEDWSETWKAHFRALRVGNVVVRPAWRQHKLRPGDIEVVLDPGMAFGTGDHPTTRACLRGVVRHLRPGMRVFDLGTGSAILAIAAAKLGAAAVLGVDIDELAVQAARVNVRDNGVAASVAIELGGLDHASVAAFGAADLVLANLNSALHVQLAAGILATVKPGCCIVASGVGSAGLRGVTQAYRAAGASALSVRNLGEWRALTITK